MQRNSIELVFLKFLIYTKEVVCVGDLKEYYLIKFLGFNKEFITEINYSY